jgi:hypothetical protein
VAVKVPTLATAIRPALDAIRGLGGVYGLRPFKVVVRRRTWTGSRPGLPSTTKTDVDVVLVNQMTDGTKEPVMVKQVSRTEAISSGGQYTSRDLKVGPITPSFAKLIFPAGGFDDGTIDPFPTGAAVELIWIVSSPSGTFGMPPGGVICEKRGEEATALHYYVVLRSTGRAPT